MPESNTSNDQPREPATLLRRLVLIRPGELPALLWSGAYFFFVLFSYYLLRPIRETMGIAGGSDKLPWVMTGTLLAMLLANPLFSALVSRSPRRVFIPLTYRFFGVNILVFYALFKLLPGHGGTSLGYAFYIWLSVFNLFVVSVFWGFMADMYSTDQGKRLFGAIAVGGTLGAIAGSFVTGRLSPGIEIPGTQWLIKPDTASLLLISLVPLELSLQCVVRLVRIFGIGAAADGRAGPSEPGQFPQRAHSPEPGPGAFKGLALIVRSPYLSLIAVYMLVFTIASTFLYMEQARIVEKTFTDRAARIRAFASIDMYANIFTLVTQVFFTARIIRLLGLGGTLAILPGLTLVGFAVLWAHPTLAVLTVFQVLRRGMHYAVDRPAREVLFTGLGPDEKYKSKSFIDTFVYRTGDLIGSWTPKWLGNIGVALGWVAVPVTALGLVIGILLGIRHKQAVRESASRATLAGLEGEDRS